MGDEEDQLRSGSQRPMPRPSEILGPNTYDRLGHFKKVEQIFADYPLKGPFIDHYLSHVVIEKSLKNLSLKIPADFQFAIQSALRKILISENLADPVLVSFENSTQVKLHKLEKLWSDLDAIHVGLVGIAGFFIAFYPREASSPFTLQFVDTVEPSLFLHSLLEPLAESPFIKLVTRIEANGLALFGTTREKVLTGSHKLPKLDDMPERAAELVAHTPLFDLLQFQVPFAIPRKNFGEHSAVFAPSGHGKTQLLQHIIADFLVAPDTPAMFIVDGMGAMPRKIAQLELINEKFKDKLVILDPEDDPPALNFFQMAGGSEAQQTELFAYLFTAIDQSLTTRQQTAVRFIVQLMRAIPGATLQTMREVMEHPAKTLDASPYEPHVATLDKTAQAYFRNQFFSSAMRQTREQVASRLYTVLSNPVFDRMFSAAENRFDAAECIAQKKIVLVNTARHFLGDDASAVFGRFIIAQCLAAALARAPIPEDQRHLALLIVDEAKDYFDAKTEKILSDARQFKLGLLFASQFVEQLPDGVRKAMYNNTAIKMAGPITYSEAVTFARETHTKPEFIQSMRNEDREFTEFATYARNVTPHAVRLRVPYGTLEKLPRMAAEDYDLLRHSNRLAYGIATPTKSMQPAAAQQKMNEFSLRDVALPLPEEVAIKIGDWVQVSLGGVDQLAAPTRVRDIQQHEGQTFVFIEGSETAVPIGNVRRVPPSGGDDSFHIKPKPYGPQ